MGITEDDLLKAMEEDRPAPPTDPALPAEPVDLDALGDEDEGVSPVRLAVAMALPVLAAAVMVGGVFIEAKGRGFAAAAGLLGVGLAVLASRIKSPLAANGLIVAGLFGIGVVMVVPSGLGNVTSVQRLASQAAASGDVLRPPVEMTAGWQAIVGWLMGIVGFAAAWVAVVVKKPSMGLLLPLPVAAIAGISVPESDQVASGLVVLVLFAVGLGVLSGARADKGDEKLPPGYEVRRALRALPLIAVVTTGLYGLAQTDFLFPDPAIDPAQEPQKPKTVPLSEVEDRVLFTVDAQISGPWRMGSLDVYDGKDWRLPAFSESELADVPRDGLVDRKLAPGVKASFNIAGLGGTVLPGLPNTVGIVAEGPKLAYDARSGSVRVAQGQVQAGLKYSVAAAALPKVDDLRQVTSAPPKDIERFKQIPPAPPAVADLMAQAPQGSKWDQFDFLRTWILTNVTATGTGAPKSVPPSRVQDMIAGSKEASPYEMVAAQAMLARWAGLPSRIGYGFDGGEIVDGKLEVRPRNGASYPEVYFEGYGWLPVIGTPTKAKPSVGGDPSTQQQSPDVAPSDEIQVGVFVPTLVEPKSVFFEELRRGVLLVLLAALVIYAAYVIWPGLRKAMARGRRRTSARESGARARIALAYAEWRDLATDFGYRYETDTPLMFLDRFAEDPEHTELAWLVTRALWGDLQDRVNDELATVAEELSRALRRRLAAAHPGPVRGISWVSRLSLRHPYAPELTDFLRDRRKHPEPPAPGPEPKEVDHGAKVA